MLPPVMKGGIASSSARWPHSAPMPDGPSILWPDSARKSTPSATTSTGMCGTLCAASSTTSAPASCAMRLISATGLIVPSALLTWLMATSFGPRARRERRSSRSSRPSSVMATNSSVAPVSAASCCHGTRFAWCSISVERIRSPAATFVRPQLRATRLIASVALRTKTTSRGLGAPMNRATAARAASKRRRVLAQLVDAAVDVGVVVAVGIGQRLDHDTRLGGRCRRVEECQRPSVSGAADRRPGNRRAAPGRSGRLGLP